MSLWFQRNILKLALCMDLWCRYSSREKKPMLTKALLMIKRNCKLYKGVIRYVYDNRNNKWR